MEFQATLLSMLPVFPALLCSRYARSGSRRQESIDDVETYWATSAKDILATLKTSSSGLSSAAAAKRLIAFGPNEIKSHPSTGRLQVLLNQVKSPLLLLLVFAAAASMLSGEWVDASLVLVIVTASVGIGYSREHRAHRAADALRNRVRPEALVLRDGQEQRLHTREIVPGDIVLLSAGTVVPADGVILEAKDCFLDEGVLTGESYPVEKRPGIAPASAPIGKRTNCVFLGANVRSGFAQYVVIETGLPTQFGSIAGRLSLRPPGTEFERGIHHYGYPLASTMSIIVVLVFAANVLIGRPPVQTLLFAIATAVGLSPELLPAILSVNLARASQSLAKHGVLVKRLNAIENLGSMDILCTDKTGTLTEGVVRLEGAYDFDGRRSAAVLELAACNAGLHTGIKNPLDEAILEAQRPISETKKLSEIPYNFVRKRLSVVVKEGDGARLITKGAFENVLRACVRLSDGTVLGPSHRQNLMEQFASWSRRGIRVLAVATRIVPHNVPCPTNDECDLEFAGFLTFLDRPKDGVSEAVGTLKALGVSIKLITGDAKFFAQHVAASVGIGSDRILTGKELDELHDEALWRAAEQTDSFVEVDPNQKERIILSLKKMGHVVGFLGDGVNDAPAMHAADTSLSVDQAVDVAKKAADFVLLDRHLDVIRRGIEEGRTTFANTLKCILITTSANLGNMVSMAIASLFLPFLPLLANQILLNNFLSDIPAVGLAGDSVDAEWIDRPRRWDIHFIKPFMLAFGLLSSAFDFITFGVLIWLFAATPMLFRTGWFVESLLTELAIALVIRTRRPFFRSRPGNLLLVTTAAVTAVTIASPYSLERRSSASRLCPSG